MVRFLYVVLGSQKYRTCKCLYFHLFEITCKDNKTHSTTMGFLKNVDLNQNARANSTQGK